MNGQVFGRLSCTIVYATDLLLSSKGTCAPYCICKLGNETVKTVTLKTPNPQWNHELFLNIYRPFELVEFNIYDEESENFLGKAVVGLEVLGDQQSHDKLLVLRSRDAKDVVSGSLLVKLQYKYTDDWKDIYNGIHEIDAGNYQVAIDLLTVALTKFPTQVQLFELRSRAYLGLNDFKSALADANKIRDINPNSSAGHYRIGKVYEAAGRLDEAKRAYNTGLTFNARDENILEAVQNLVKSAVDISAANNTEVNKAVQLFERGEFKAASEEITAAIQFDTKNPCLILAHAICLSGILRKAKNLPDNLKADLTKNIGADGMAIAQVVPTWPTQHKILDGLMKKGGEFNRMMKRRWFILASPFLYYYNKKEEKAPNGAIPLSVATVKWNKKDRIYVQVPGRTYELVAPNAAQWFPFLKSVAETQLQLPDISDMTTKVRSSVRVELPAHLKRTSSNKRMSVFREALVRPKVQLDNRENIVKEGILYKAGKVRKVYKKRYFILKPQSLYYFEDKPVGDNPVALGLIDLREITWRKGESGAVMGRHEFELDSPTRNYFLYTITPQDLLEWKKAIELCSKPDFRPEMLLGDSTGSAPNSSPIGDRASRLSSTPTTPSAFASTPPSSSMLSPTSPHRNEQAPPSPAAVEDIPLYSSQNTLPKLSESGYTVSEKLNDSGGFTFTEAAEEPASHTLSLSNGSGNSPALGSEEMSDSESRFFRKFGLTPPEGAVNRRQSVILTPSIPTQLTTNPTQPSRLQPTVLPSATVSVGNYNKLNTSNGSASASVGSFPKLTINEAPSERPMSLSAVPPKSVDPSSFTARGVPPKEEQTPLLHTSNGKPNQQGRPPQGKPQGQRPQQNPHSGSECSCNLL